MAINPLPLLKLLGRGGDDVAKAASKVNFSDMLKRMGLSDDALRGGRNLIQPTGITPGASSAFPRQVPTGIIGGAKKLYGKLPFPFKLAGAAGLLYGGAKGLFGDEKEQLGDSAAWVKELSKGSQSPAELAAKLNAANQAAFDASQGKYAAGLNQGLEDYIKSMQGYVSAQAPAIQKGYADLASQARATGAQTAAESMGAGRETADLYNQLAAQLGDYTGGEGISSPGTAVSGLTGVSGEAAAAPDLARTQGASISDYLTREGTIARDLADTIGTSYESQGLGTVNQMAAAAQAMEANRRSDLAEKLADYQAQRDAQQMQLSMAAAERDIQAEAAGAEQARVGALSQLRADQIWKALEDQPDLRSAIGSVEQLRELLRTNPDIISILGL